MENTNTFFTIKSIQKVYLYDAIKAVLFSTKPFVVSNSKSCKNFIDAVINYVVIHKNNGLYPTYRSVYEKFNKDNITSGKDLVNVIIDNKEMLSKIGYKIDKLKVPSKSPKTRKKNLDEYKSFGRNSYIGMETTRTLAVRSKLGGHEVKFYEYSGALKSDEQLTNIKMDYHYSTGCKYYDVRPILLSTWLTLSPERQVATCNVEIIGKED